MDGRLITEMRTAAVSAAVTKRLASPESRVLALLGSGVQAKAHLEALSQVRRFAEVRVWSRTPEHARSFAAQHGARALDAEAAVRGADLVVTATNALEPILEGAWLSPVRTSMPSARHRRRGGSSTTRPCGASWRWTRARRRSGSPAT